MTRSEYMRKALELYDANQITGDVYDSMISNVDIFCDDDDDDDDDDYYYGLPSTYAEIEYDDFENAEAVEGARFDDMNYLRYTER